MKKKTRKNYENLVPGVDYDEHAEGVDDSDEDEDFDEDEDEDEDEVEAKPKRARLRRSVREKQDDVFVDPDTGELKFRGDDDFDDDDEDTGVKRRSRLKHKKRGRSAPSRSSFLALPHQVLEGEIWKKLRPAEKALLVDLATQYRGNNNGKLVCSPALMKDKGWASTCTTHKALKRLITLGQVKRVRKGGPGRPSWYSIPWLLNSRKE